MQYQKWKYVASVKEGFIVIREEGAVWYLFIVLTVSRDMELVTLYSGRRSVPGAGDDIHCRHHISLISPDKGKL